MHVSSHKTIPASTEFPWNPIYSNPQHSWFLSLDYRFHCSNNSGYAYIKRWIHSRQLLVRYANTMLY